MGLSLNQDTASLGEIIIIWLFSFQSIAILAALKLCLFIWSGLWSSYIGLTRHKCYKIMYLHLAAFGTCCLQPQSILLQKTIDIWQETWRLTCNFDPCNSALGDSSGGPGDAVAPVSFKSKIFFHFFPADVKTDLKMADPRLRVDKLLLAVMPTEKKSKSELYNSKYKITDFLKVIYKAWKNLIFY